jgi:hypothetical protein
VRDIAREGELAEGLESALENATDTSFDVIFPDLTDTDGYSVFFEYEFANGQVIAFDVMDGLVGVGDIRLGAYEDVIQEIISHEISLTNAPSELETPGELETQGALVEEYCAQMAIWCWNRLGSKWPDTTPFGTGEVNFDTASFTALPTNLQQMFADAANELEANTGLFFGFASSGDRIGFRTNVAADDCSSELGRAGGLQYIHMGANCDSAMIARHELGHAVGLIHEHQRYDRDNYITVYLQRSRIPAAHRIWPQDRTAHMTSFDFDSVMIYGSYEANLTGQPVMVDKQGNTFTGNWYYSQGDYATLRHFYP